MCNFSIPFSGPVQNVLDRAKKAVQDQGGMFNGNDVSGVFQVTVVGSTIKGSYAVSPQNLKIVIDTKPFFVPCTSIENFLRGHISNEQVT